MTHKTLTICCLGVGKPSNPRDTVCLRGLELQGHRIIECVDASAGLKKYWNLVKKHWSIRKNYDIVFVTYSSRFVVPLARLISSKKIVFNALSPFYDSEVLNRKRYLKYSPQGIWSWLSDYISFHSAHLLLIETNARIESISKRYFVSPKKCARVWTSADEMFFFPDANVPKSNCFTVVWRGYFLPSVAMEIIVEAAGLLKDADVFFHIIGRGYLKAKILQMVRKLNSPNVKLDIGFLDGEYLRTSMREAHVSLGQFSCTEEIQQTITHKTFESIALGIPVITAESKGTKELLDEGVHVLYTRCGNARDLAEKILTLKNNPTLREQMGKNCRTLFEEKLTNKTVGEDLSHVLNNLLS